MSLRNKIYLILVCMMLATGAMQAEEVYDYSVFRKGSPIDIRIGSIINNFGPYTGYSPVLVGDLTGDGVPELVTVVTDYRNHGGSFIVIDGANKARHKTISFGKKFGTPDVSFGYACGPLAISRNRMIYAVVGTAEQKTLLAYRVGSTVDDIALAAEAPLEHNFYGNPRIADFNEDGREEVFVGNEVFDAQTLTPIGSGGDGNVGRHYQHDGAMFMMGCAADVLPDSPGLELVCGNQIFSVNGSGVMLMRTIGDKLDGSSQVADFDNDGYPEILVRSSMGRLSMYSVKEGKELFNDEYVMSAHPAVGDIDGDSIPEIVGLVSPSRMAAYKYDPQNSRLVTQWEIAHSDRSAQTSMVIFDFNGDGSGEIVYRDQTSLRIIDGSGRKPQTIANMMVSSATKSEYPVVADIDGDGQAEILISGTMYRDFKKDNASINIFKSNRWAWASAPAWWGQY